MTVGGSSNHHRSLARSRRNLAQLFLYFLCCCYAGSLVDAGATTVVEMAANAECPMDCGPFGNCVDVVTEPQHSWEVHPENSYVCQCQPGWSGADCSFRHGTVCHTTTTTSSTVAEQQQHEQVCLNGGVCEEVMVDDEDHRVETRCNCQARIATASQTTAAGHQCEFVHQVVCEQGPTTSAYAFCVNDGTCRAMVSPGAPHPLCDCPPAWEGRHCQFPVGTAPTAEQVYMNVLLQDYESSTSASTTSGGGLSPRSLKMVVSLVSLGGGVILVLAVYLLRRQHTTYRLALSDHEWRRTKEFLTEVEIEFEATAPGTFAEVNDYIDEEFQDNKEDTTDDTGPPNSIVVRGTTGGGWDGPSHTEEVRIIC